jgi:CHAT domain-containing protein
LPDTALLEIAVLDGEVVVFCVRNGNVTMHRSPIAAAALRARIAELRRRVAYDSPERIRAAGSELYGLLFGGARASIESAGSLVIVPDDALQHVPFAALWRPSAGQYLGQSHVVSIAPSAALLVSRTTPVPPRRAILLVGNSAGDERESLAYLSSVEDEIAALRKVYRASRVMLGRDASKARFIAEAGSYDVIHFAGHGLSDDESLQAALLFAPGATNDAGRMSMGDIAQLRLARAPLVVLAACGTLRGRTGGIEGMPSLARSFLAAGAATVIGTVQDIDDATAGRLLASFHRSIAAGTSPATALRDAQRDAIARGGEDAHPKHWAPYVVYTATP